jgi:ubiquinone/menaquinone biosynthesis C-methylase UbiE
MASLLRTGVIASITALTSVFAKPYFQEFLGNPSGAINYVAVGFAVIALTAIMLALDWLIALPYARSVRLRRFLDHSSIQPKPFLEGFWVDVGIDTSTSIPRIVGYAFISIIRHSSECKISGRTWNVAGVHQHDWESVWMVRNENPLEFWYRATSETTTTPVVAKAKFTFAGGKFPDKYAGEYADAFSTRARRVTSIDFDELWSTALADSRKKSLGEQYLREYIKECNFDPETFMPLRTSRTDLHHAYLTFVRLSNQKEEEQSLIAETLNAPQYHRAAKAILDLGPGEGMLSTQLLSAMASSSATYVAAEPSGAALDELAERLSGLKLTKTTLIKQTAETFLAGARAGQFDLIIALNSLYYVSGFDDVFREIVRVLQPGGLLAALHTAIDQVDVLGRSIEHANPRIVRSVSERLQQLAENGSMSKVDARARNVTIEFPSLSEAQWELVSERIPGDTAADDVANLICFLLYLESNAVADDTWKEFVQQLKQHLRGAGGKLRLPILFQLFKKPG